MADMSPMMQQYCRIKDENPGTLLFFRLGDFYEMFFDDAKLASKELELTLTHKACGLENDAPMCGVPFHSCEGYIARLVAKGYKVAICEQTEDPSKAKGLVKRDIVRVVTPGTVTESSMLDESRNNYLASIAHSKGETAVCFVDTSTGEMHLTVLTGSDLESRLCNELGSYMPKEIICDKSCATKAVVAFIRDRIGGCFEIIKEENLEIDKNLEILKKHFSVNSAEELGLASGSTGVICAGTAISYLLSTQMTGLENIRTIDVYSTGEFMKLDLSARRNLELFETMRSKEKRGSLLWVLDKTSTAMGKRMLRAWLEQPLLKPAAITRRLNAVNELYNNAPLCDELSEILSGIYDLERLMTRVVYSSANAPDLLSLASAVSSLPAVRAAVADSKSAMIKDIYASIDELQDVMQLIRSAIDEKAPAILRDGGFIKAGYDELLDTTRDDMNGGSATIAAIEARERERTGIKNLKVGFNKVFGYYIEITNAFKHLTPDDYIRKQTTTNAERYITQELKELEHRVLGAKEKSIQLEYELFCKVRSTVGEQLSRVQTTASAVARLDVLVSLARVAIKHGYCCPEIASDGKLTIKDGRHPVVETVIDSPFVPNDTELDMNKNRCAIITGPNMAGKSTYMRQVALITIMAQIGSFVPANSAHIGIVDAVYTRVGASDDLYGGQSTFMVEMSEVSGILKNATRNSLLILDEIGRGTSTYDGMSIARAVLEYIVSKKLGAKAMFATHYHELTELSNTLEGVKNYNIAVKKRGDDITFLRRIIPGGADRSYGIEVAALAGVPKTVVERAKEILAELENGEYRENESPKPVQDDGGQLSFLSAGVNPIAEKLKTVDLNTLTPI